MFERPTRFGLIAGDGEYPIIITKEAIKNGSEIIGIGFTDITSPQLAELIPNFIWTPFGKIEPIVNAFMTHNINKAIFAGKIHQSVIFKTDHFDPLVKNTLEKLPTQQADSLIGAATKAFGMFGVDFLDARTFMEDHLAHPGVMTECQPDENQMKAIEYGYKLAKHIAEEDIGQTVVVKNRAVLAVEAMEGTDRTIERAMHYGKEGITIVKVSKPKQDFRYDIPVIGLDTLELVKSIPHVVIAVEAEKTLMLNRDKVIHRANELGICLYGVEA